MSINDLLPNEIFSQIFKKLTPQDLHAAVLVCRSWMKIGEDPRLWTWAMVRICNISDSQKLNIHRLQRLQNINMTCPCYPCQKVGVYCKWNKKTMTELFNIILKIPSVRWMQCNCKSVSGVEPHLLASVLNRLKKLDIGRPWLNLHSEQLEVLLTAMAQKTNVKLLCVHYDYYNVARMNPELFATAISNVAVVSMESYYPSSEQLTALFSVITVEDKPLREIQLPYLRIDNVDPDILGRAINRLEVFYGESGGIDDEQIYAILRILDEGGSRLKNLTLPLPIYGDVDLISRARALTSVSFYHYYYSDE
jgi:hypothetical protein